MDKATSDFHDPLELADKNGPSNLTGLCSANKSIPSVCKKKEQRRPIDKP